LSNEGNLYCSGIYDRCVGGRWGTECTCGHVDIWDCKIDKKCSVGASEPADQCDASPGDVVTYTYIVGPVSAYDARVEVTDDQLGVVAANLPVPLFGVVEFTAITQIFQTTTNTAWISSAAGAACFLPSNGDSVTVTVVGGPTPTATTTPTATPTAPPPPPTGSVVGWGYDNYDQATPPDAVNGVSGTATDIAAGGYHSCAIQAVTGDLVCWGRNNYGQATPPDAVNGVSGTATDIAAGYWHSCAIQAGTGDVVCWGDDSYGGATPPDDVNGVSGTATDITVGWYHSCAIQAGTDNVVCWGSDRWGAATPPDAVNGVSGTAIDIAAGYNHSCAIQAGSGNVVCWGRDGSGQATPPDAVNGVLGTATDIAAGTYHSCAIQAGTGNVVCWSDDSSGRATPPDAVNGVSGTATDIAAGSYHTLAIFGARSDCLCEVQNINPNQVVLQNVGTGGKGAKSTRKMVVTVHAVDAPGVTCDPGEFSNPTAVNLKMEDDRGNILIDSAKTVVCKQGGVTNLKRNVFFQGPLNCENGAVPPPKPDFSLGTITSTGSGSVGTSVYVENTKIKCFE